MISLLKGDCLELMKDIPDGSIDMILCDLPYGTTQCKWDSVIPFEPLWEQYKRIIKDNGAICLFGSEPFSTLLRYSNLKMYRYDWIWKKEQGANFMLCKYQPYKVHEIISVFSKKTHIYLPQMTEGTPYISGKGTSGAITRNVKKIQTKNSGTRYPRSIQRFNTEKSKGSFHPTQKPVALLESLIKIFTDPGDVVIDPVAGSGSTLRAAANIGRRGYGFEIKKEFARKAKEMMLSTIEPSLFEE
jgi:site-specific DNA-methyltransferase (adenine-specific)